MQPKVTLFDGASAPNKRLGRMSGAAADAAMSLRTLRRSVVWIDFMNEFLKRRSVFLFFTDTVHLLILLGREDENLVGLVA
jgi:hypothetical protein